MWIARDKEGTLAIYKYYPERTPNGSAHVGQWCSDYDIYSKEIVWDDTFTIDSTLFPNLKWEDEPIEVELVIVEQKEK